MDAGIWMDEVRMNGAWMDGLCDWRLLREALSTAAKD